MLLARTSSTSRFLQALRPADLILLVGAAALMIPTMIEVARFSWSTEQGGHGPLVLATGLWLLLRELKDSHTQPRSRRVILPAIALAALLAIYVLARITGVLEIEALAMYGALIVGAYMLFGGALIRAIWFPLVYLAFALPPPDSLVAAVTQPLKIAISELAVALLHFLGYPIASSGVMIQIAQYELLVAAACAGLNSIVSLGAICLFYVYIRHRTDVAAFLFVALAVIPIAVFSNFVRVITLILITYYLGESAAQGFLHDFAGLLMFAVALVSVFALDAAFAKVRGYRVGTAS